jgi:hypothetical protein
MGKLTNYLQIRNKHSVQPGNETKDKKQHAYYINRPAVPVSYSFFQESLFIGL